MQIEIFSHPKARNRAQPGDDVILAIPGLVFAVLDGATDPSGVRYQGQTGGRSAAVAAAQSLATLLGKEGCDVPLTRIGDVLSASVAAAAAHLGIAHPPSTTLAAAVQLPHGFRLLVIGDSGIRLNGGQVTQPEKLIDRVSTALRLSVRRILQTRIGDADLLESACREVVALGLDSAIGEDALSRREVMNIVAELQAALSASIEGAEEDFLVFVRRGLISQPAFANNPTHRFGYASIIGTPPRGFGIQEEFVPLAEFRSIELFTDGYFALPRGTCVRDWETRFAEIERIDPAKTGPFASVKGSTSSEFADDRTVICLNGDGEQMYRSLAS